MPCCHIYVHTVYGNICNYKNRKTSKGCCKGGKEDFSYALNTTSQDEIGELITSFSKMERKLNYLINEVYKSRIKEKEYEMKALQAQINPHFLYNTLSLINWKAIEAGKGI